MQTESHAVFEAIPVCEFIARSSSDTPAPYLDKMDALHTHWKQFTISRVLKDADCSAAVVRITQLIDVAYECVQHGYVWV
jgi:hypothetical protein